MTPRDITEFFYRLDRATEAFFNAVIESADRALEDAREGVAAFIEEASFILPEPLEVEERDEWLRADEYLSVSGESDRFVDDPDFHRDRFFQFYVGDTTCRFNALNPDLRCAVNPYGPCKCPHYEQRDATNYV